MMGVAIMVPLSSCHGIFDGIYDEPIVEENDGFGFIKVDEALRTGTIYIDASDYTQWHYIDFKSHTVTDTYYADDCPQAWDFAIHRYDTKTNGGKVAETDCTELEKTPAPTLIPESDFVTDIWTENKITVDMSGMMQGNILYAPDYYNACLSQWLDVDTSSMPPSYTLSGKVYVLRLTDGTYAALQLVNFMNDAAIKGYMTINYIYPIKQ